MSFSFYCRENSLVERTYENEWMRYCNALRSEYTFFSVVGRVGGEGDFKKNLRRSKTNNQKILFFFSSRPGLHVCNCTHRHKNSPLLKSSVAEIVFYRRRGAGSTRGPSAGFRGSRGCGGDRLCRFGTVALRSPTITPPSTSSSYCRCFGFGKS